MVGADTKRAKTAETAPRQQKSAAPLVRRTTSPSATDTPPGPPKRYARLSPFWKALIVTSFVMNAILLTIVLLLGGFAIWWRAELADSVVVGKDFAVSNITELRNVVAELETSTIVTSIPLDQPLPLRGSGIVVPVNQEPVVTLVDPVPLTLSNADIDLGNGNRLRANNIALTLPAGTPLKIKLNLNIPLDDVTIPIKLNVPVKIPLKDTELGPLFKRLGTIVDNLVGPFAPLLGIEPKAKP